MKIPFEEKWIIAEKEDYANYLYVTSVWQYFTVLPQKQGLKNPRYLSAEYINKSCNIILNQKSYEEVSKNYFQSLFNSPDLWDKIHRETRYYSNQLAKYAKEIKNRELRSLTSKRLLQIRKKFDNLQVEVHGRRGYMWIIETKENVLSDYLQNYLKEKIKDYGIKRISAIHAFQILTSPVQKSIIRKEKEDLIKIAFNKDKLEQKKALKLHTKKYEWLEYGLQGNILDFNYFNNELAKLKGRGLVKLRREQKKEIEKLRKEQQNITKLFKIDKKHQKIFKIAREAIFLKGYSKDKQFYSYYCMENLLKEIGRRAGLTLEQVRFLYIDDYKDILINKKDYSRITNDRMKYSIHFADKGKTVIYTGKTAKSVRKKLKFVEAEKLTGDEKEIKGQPAFQGKVRGKVKVINTPQEMIKMHQDDILVSHMTNPDIVPVMKKASAIVTDLGGITCHAAIVARELKKPCVIGTKIATTVLKDGDRVEVDAGKGMVKIQKKNG